MTDFTSEFQKVFGNSCPPQTDWTVYAKVNKKCALDLINRPGCCILRMHYRSAAAAIQKEEQRCAASKASKRV